MDVIAPWADPVLMTAEELAGLPEDGWRYELVEGRLVRISPTGREHNRVGLALLRAVDRYVEEHGLGQVYMQESGFRLDASGTAETVLAPDLAFVRAEREPGPEVKGYPRLAPDVVAEIVSPSQRRGKMQAKARLWLDSGVQVVWLVFPEQREVEVWRGAARTRTLVNGDSLTGEEVLPGFVLQVSRLFA